MEGNKRVGSKASFLTVVSFSLLAVGARDAQNAVDGVGSYGIVGGAGHWGRRCVGNWRKGNQIQWWWWEGGRYLWVLFRCKFLFCLFEES